MINKDIGEAISRVLYLATIFLGLPSPTGSSDLPSGKRRAAAFQALCGTPQLPPCLVLLRVGFTWTQDVTTLPVSSYLAVSPLPFSRRYISVALSLRLPSPDVIRHPRPVEPGLSSRRGSLPGPRSPASPITLKIYHIYSSLSRKIFESRSPVS